MSSVEESPAQKAARLRRERREAKIKEGGAARLDKITSLTGRTLASAREDAPTSLSPSTQPSAPVSSAPEATSALRQPEPPSVEAAPNTNPETQSPESLQAQQEYIRALLRQDAPPQGQSGQEDFEEEDVTIKLLNSLMGNMSGGGASGPGDAPGVSQADLISALGFPSWAASMLPGVSQPQTEAEKKAIWTWKILHVLFSIAVGIYLIVLVGSSVSIYGSRPPPPATARNPFLFFTTGELVMTGARVLSRRGNGPAGLGLYIQVFRDVIRDGSVIVFLLGMATWWTREWTVY
ncbi:hypothetical protein EYZ11_004234 [Aspergillus tanneri]|uniref:GET complex, subunit GET2 n=1 Tax=Aspergillus tanneri TaxID=1220188 RepID=A0A4V3UPS2_9EURO|nr:uncharacterized protein ATNIH1004_004617 [Aspergillus tanneri]KAA8648732.1 hypothetical protein ATNIH1004_004617 [Aspergillus tanneri]THC96284.1 hypothetical protein EYZ11_004234 [Aspergillus tanneri]